MISRISPGSPGLVLESCISCKRSLKEGFQRSAARFNRTSERNHELRNLFLTLIFPVHEISISCSIHISHTSWSVFVWVLRMCVGMKPAAVEQHYSLQSLSLWPVLSFFLSFPGCVFRCRGVKASRAAQEKPLHDTDWEKRNSFQLRNKKEKNVPQRRPYEGHHAALFLSRIVQMRSGFLCRCALWIWQTGRVFVDDIRCNWLMYYSTTGNYIHYVVSSYGLFLSKPLIDVEMKWTSVNLFYFTNTDSTLTLNRLLWLISVINFCSIKPQIKKYQSFFNPNQVTWTVIHLPVWALRQRKSTEILTKRQVWCICYFVLRFFLFCFPICYPVFRFF